MLEDLIASKKSLFTDGVHTELRAQENRYRSVALVQGNLLGNSRSETSGICARVCKNGVFGFSSMAEYSASAAEAVLKAATNNALFLNQRAPKNKPAIPKLPEGTVPVNRVIVDNEQKKYIDFCKELDDYIAKTYPKLTSRSIYYTEDSMDKILYTSDGHDGHTTSPRCYIYVTMNSETLDGTPIELYEVFGGAGNFDDNFSKVELLYPKLDELYKKVMDKRAGVYAEAGYKTVILGGILSGMLAHEAVGHTVEADLVLGGSVAGPNLNKRVASDLVTLVDFAHTALGKQAPLPVYLDDEGTPAEDAIIIENGILKGYMNNRETAAHYGVKPVGNARGFEFSDEPLIRMRNTAVLPGKDKLEDMIASVEDGYYLLNTGNGQADLTGEFMFGVNMGYEIKNGKLGRAILDTTVSGVAFDMLKTVDMVSDEMVWSSSGFCGKKQAMPVGMGGPALRCKIMMGGR